MRQSHKTLIPGPGISLHITLIKSNTSDVQLAHWGGHINCDPVHPNWSVSTFIVLNYVYDLFFIIIFDRAGALLL